MEDRSIEDSLAVIEFEKEDDQNKRRTSKIIVSANGERGDK